MKIKQTFPYTSTSTSATTCDENATQINQELQEEAAPPKARKHRRSLKDENQKLKEKVAFLQEQILRLQADLRNIRRRYDREMADILIYGYRQFFEKLLPLVDDLERSLKMSDHNRNFVAFRNGVEMIYRNLMKLLQEEGVRPIQAIGRKFDYNKHDAVLSVKKPGVEPGVVVEEIQKGYYYKDKILRHAKVIVSK